MTAAIVRQSQAMVRAGLFLGAGQLIARLQSFVTIAVAARILDTKAFGAMVIVQATAMLAASVWDLGTTTYLSRELAADRLSPEQAIRQGYQVRILAAAPTIAATLPILYFTTDTSIISIWAIALFIASALTAALATIYNSVLVGLARLRESVQRGSTGRIAGCVLPCVLLLPFDQTWTKSLEALGAISLATEVLILLLLRRAACRIPSANPLTGKTTMTTAGRNTLPYALHSALNFAYNKGDILILSALATSAVATYAPASQLQNALSILPAMLLSGLVPIQTRALMDVHSRSAAVGVIRFTAIRLFMASIPVTLILMLSAPVIIRLLFGPGFEAAVVPSQIIFWSLPFLCLLTPLLQTLIALGRPGDVALTMMGAFLASLASHAVLDPIYGATGAAVASLVRDPVACGIAFALFARCSKVRYASDQEHGHE